MARIVPLPAVTLFLYFIIISQLRFTTSKPLGLTLKLIPRDSPESPLYPGNLTQLERIQRMIKFSKARVAYLGSFSNPNATMDPANRIIMPLHPDECFWVVKVEIGTPSTTLFLLMDTGGGLIWTQCEPCIKCFRQTYPIYNSQTSSTYRKLPCDHPLCQGPNRRYDCVDQQCIYDFAYAGGSSTKGVASVESFKFSLNNASGTIVDGIIFGCSNDNEDFAFSESSGATSGIMGLSFSPDSLASQLYYLIDRRYSYCLVPFEYSAPAYLKFGNDIPPPSRNIQTTRFVTPPGSYYFYLNLIDISVGNHRLGFPPNFFRIRQDDSGGFLIDSGALFTHLDETPEGFNAYKFVMGAFQRYYDSLHLQRLGTVIGDFELCYTLPQGFTNFATMTYHFEGASYHVEKKYVNRYYPNFGYFCVAILSAEGISALGAWHQQNKRIIYNGNLHALQFYPENCANDTPP